MKKSIVVLVAAAGGIGLYVMYLKNQALKTNPQKGNRPVNTVGSSRRDNANQPWYAAILPGVKAQVGKTAADIQANPTAALANFGSVIHSLGSIFGSSDASGTPTSDWTNGAIETTAGSPDENPESDSSMEALMASGEDQSNMIGDQMNDPVYSENLGVEMTFDNPPDGSGMIASDNSDFSAEDYNSWDANAS